MLGKKFATVSGSREGRVQIYSEIILKNIIFTSNETQCIVAEIVRSSPKHKTNNVKTHLVYVGTNQSK